MRLPQLFKKSAPSGAAVSLDWPLARTLTGQDYQKVATEGYTRCGVVYLCVNEIAKALATLPVQLFETNVMGERDELVKHPLLDLIRNPNPLVGWKEFLTMYVCYYLLGGVAALHAIGPDDGTPQELWLLRPDGLNIEDDPSTGLVRRVRYNLGTRQLVFDFDLVTGTAGELRLVRAFNPLDELRGLSTVLVAAFGIDIHNASSVWNARLLQNGGKPPGILQSDGKIDESKGKALRDMLKTRFSGPENAGTPLIVDMGLKWQSLGFTAVEMDWLNGRNQAAREIAQVMGVPPLLLGLPRDSTYSNYAEARIAFYENTVLPMMDRLLEHLNAWLAPRFGDNLELVYDDTELPVMKDRASRRMASVNGLSFLTANEKREMFGYEPVDGGDVLPATVDPMAGLFGQGPGAASDFAVGEAGAGSPQATLEDRLGALEALQQKQDPATVARLHRLAYGERDG